ncbi:hypothetical protein ANN_17567 [Periplaneta americana]|uniref:DUF659 domain-containing protein n=1 Tax=Periplaneta americana TaxID=6978 RepID=A0ABQ8STV8_PERAM|nr:hypothetical protein ANN_17567 [Periplaneta americana]
MSPGSSTESYPAFTHIGLRKNPGKNLNQVNCPDRDSDPGHLVSQPDALTDTLKLNKLELHSQIVMSACAIRETTMGKIVNDVLDQRSLAQCTTGLAYLTRGYCDALLTYYPFQRGLTTTVLDESDTGTSEPEDNVEDCAVSSTQKFLVQQHITTSKHQANKQLNSKQRQLFLTQPTTSNVRSEFNIDLCRSLISADIPLYKLKNKVFREFLEKYTQHTIPDESTLRKTYAPSIYDETIQKIRDEIKDSSIWVSIDETPDKEGRLVGNVVIGLLSEQYSERILLHCDVLEKCNNKTIVKLFNEAMGILWPKGIMYDNVLFFISDAALIWSKLDKHYLLYILN